MSVDLQTVNPADSETELMGQLDQITKKGESSDEEKRQFREKVLSTPGSWRWLTLSSDVLRQEIIADVDHDWVVCARLAEVDIQKKLLGYEQATALEKMLIDHLLTAWVRLICVEFKYNSRAQQCDSNTARLWDNRLKAAHTLFLKAAEMLAKVHKLLGNAPSVQIYIDQRGGKQVNVQGDVKGFPSPETTANNEQPVN